MVIGILVNPQSFGPAIIQTLEEARAAEQLLQGVIDNGCLTMAPGESVRDLIDITQNMPTVTGQYIQILVGEVVTRQCSIEAKGFPNVAMGLAPCRRLSALAEHASPNIAIYATDAERNCIQAVAKPEVEVCHISEYSHSQAEQLRRKWWRESAPLHKLDKTQTRHVLLHAIRYSQVITIADRMIARHLNQRQFKALDNSLRGIAWLVDIWQHGSPFAAHHHPTVRVISEGGPTVGAGMINPAPTKAEIERRLRALLPRLPPQNITVSLKRDSSPSIFKDRYIRANNRTFLIRHSMDDFGVLAAREAASASTRAVTPTYIHRCEDGSANDLDDILGLPEA